MAKIHFDAATKGNPGRSACAIIIKENSQRYAFTHDLGEMDNHSAEWAAMLHALEHARELKVSNALLYTDSKLIEDSMLQGKVKNTLVSFSNQVINYHYIKIPETKFASGYKLLIGFYL